MTLPDMHPYAGRAMTLKRAMSSTQSPGATPHTEGHPWSEEDSETSRQILRRRLAKKQDRLEERDETVSAQRLRIQELEAEVERLTKSLRQIRTEANRLQGHGVSSVDDIWYTAHQALKGLEGSTDG